MSQIEITYLSVSPEINKDDKVRVVSSGNITEIMKFDHKNEGSSIRVIDKDHYIRIEDYEKLLYSNDFDGDITGIIQDRSHGVSRMDNVNFVRTSFKSLRDIINTNCVDCSRCLWITLTYQENMTDNKRLYTDFRDFIKRLRYRIGSFEYIVACEPQKRGAWHMHCIFIFEDKAPFIPNKELAECWGFGFVKVNSLKDIDNVGAYLSAYLCDMDIDENVVDDTIKKKRYIKGARLSLYPVGMHIWRISKGIKKPTIEYMRYEDAKQKEKVSSAKLTYSKNITLTDSSSDFNNCLVYEYYNSAIKENQ